MPSANDQFSADLLPFGQYKPGKGGSRALASLDEVGPLSILFGHEQPRFDSDGSWEDRIETVRSDRTVLLLEAFIRHQYLRRDERKLPLTVTGD